MTAQAFLQGVSQVSLLILFSVTLVRLFRSPSWANVDISLFFGIFAVLVVTGTVVGLLGLGSPPALNTLTWVGVTALPLVLLRLADDFRPRPPWLVIGATILYLAVAAVGVSAPQPWSDEVVLVAVIFVVGLAGYASLVFVREAAERSGVTRRRMQAVAAGSGLLVILILLAALRSFVPAAGDSLPIISQLVALAMVLSYFIGFAPPSLLRRAWQEPAIRGLLSETPDLLRLPDPWEISERVAERAVSITGADGAVVSLWDPNRNRLVSFEYPTGDRITFPSGEYIAGRAFERQATVSSDRPDRDAPEHAQTYLDRGIRAIAATPISSGDQRLGVLTVFAARPPVFTEDVLSVLTAVAEQAALVLHARDLIAHSAGVEAFAEVTRMRDEFLAGIAHDLRTPITPILLNAELLVRSLGDDGRQAARAASIRDEAIRLKELVDDYLTVIASEHGREVTRERQDLGVLVRQTMVGMHDAHRVRLDAPAPVVGEWDAPRIRRLVENLLSNALKYSPPSAPVTVTVSADQAGACLTVTDQGVGIPPAEQARIFERFQRVSDPDRYGPTGIGLGLYICRQVAEEHGGSISVSSDVNQGATFTVRLPLSAGSVPDAAPAASDGQEQADPARHTPPGTERDGAREPAATADEPA